LGLKFPDLRQARSWERLGNIKAPSAGKTDHLLGLAGTGEQHIKTLENAFLATDFRLTVKISPVRIDIVVAGSGGWTCAPSIPSN
jgi:hypothetical protein